MTIHSCLPHASTTNPNKGQQTKLNFTIQSTPSCTRKRKSQQISNKYSRWQQTIIRFFIQNYNNQRLHLILSLWTRLLYHQWKKKLYAAHRGAAAFHNPSSSTQIIIVPCSQPFIKLANSLKVSHFKFNKVLSSKWREFCSRSAHVAVFKVTWAYTICRYRMSLLINPIADNHMLW